MDSSELIELFYNRAYEKFVNKQILDDKNYLVPRQQLTNYVHELTKIPYIDFIQYIRISGVERKVEASDITQFSSFSACELEMCNALIWANNPGCQYVDIGRLFPNNIISRSDSSYRRYGESHIKSATQLGLTFEYYNYWYLSCLGYIYPDLEEDVRVQLLARTITRNRLYKQLLFDIMEHDVNPETYIDILPEYMMRKSLRSVCTFLDICINACKNENLKTHALIKSYETFKPAITVQLPADINENLRTYLTEFDFRNLSNETTSELIKKYKKGDSKAYALLIKGHMRLVLNIAKTYNHKGVDYDELIQEGTMGLIKAIDHFNANVSISFNKYASWWIMQSITQALVTLPYIVQIPLNTIILHRKVRNFVNSYEQEQGYLPSVDDIDVNGSSDLEWLTYIYQLPADLKNLTTLIEDFDLYESSAPGADYFQEAEYNSYFVNRQLHFLTDRNRTILQKYFGIGDNQEEETLNTIGDYFGLTRERARQIVEKSIRELQGLSGIKRDEAMIGDLIRLDLSEQVGRVVNKKQGLDGSTILILKMDAGNTKEIAANDSSYEILPKKIIRVKPEYKSPTVAIQTKEKKLFDQSKKAQERFNIQREIDKYDEVRVGDKLKYNGKECTICKIICRGDSSRFLVEYVNGIRDYVANDKSKYRILPSISIPQKQAPGENKTGSEPKRQNVKEAAVGDRIIYNSKPCVVLEKSKKYNIVRLKVKYDDGRIDDVLGDQSRYEILNRHGKKAIPSPIVKATSIAENIVPCHKVIETSQRKCVEDSYGYFTRLIMNLNQAIVHGKKILAKPALLVAVIDSIESKEILQNKIVITPSLENKYNAILSKYTDDSLLERLTSIGMPFWHLKSEKFWFLEPSSLNVERMTPSKKWLIDNVEYARLDGDLWNMLQEETWRKKLRGFIVEHKLKESAPRKNSVQLDLFDNHARSENTSKPKFLLSTKLRDLVELNIITQRQYEHCNKKGLKTIGDVKKKIEYYNLTPNSARFTKYTIDMWFRIVGLLKNNV